MTNESFNVSFSAQRKDPPQGDNVTEIHKEELKMFCRTIPIIGTKIPHAILEILMGSIKTIKIEYNMDLAIFQPKGTWYLRVK